MTNQQAPRVLGLPLDVHEYVYNPGWYLTGVVIGFVFTLYAVRTGFFKDITA
jgi:hypothetical protein